MPPGITTLAADAPELSAANTGFMLICSALVMLMTPGLAFFYGGMVRVKSTLNMLMMSFISLGIVTILWVLYGFSLAFGSDVGSVIGWSSDYVGLSNIGVTELWDGYTIPVYVFAVFQLMFAVLTPALISGALADRVKFTAWAVFIVLWVSVVYFPVAHWVWGTGGWLFEMGVIDFMRRYGRPHQQPAPPPSASFWSSASASASRRTRCGRTVCRSSCSARPSCGSAGSASTPDPGSATTTASARSCS